jgi:hypothetical protein
LSSPALACPPPAGWNQPHTLTITPSSWSHHEIQCLCGRQAGVKLEPFEYELGPLGPGQTLDHLRAGKARYRIVLDCG